MFDCGDSRFDYVNNQNVLAARAAVCAVAQLGTLLPERLPEHAPDPTPEPAADRAAEQLILLMARIAQGDSDSFRELYRLTARRLLPQALRIVGKLELAEDVIQESFMAVWRDASSYDRTRSAPFTWMSVIVRNKSIDCLRANQTGNQQRVSPGSSFSDSSDSDNRSDAADDALYARADPGASPCELLERRQRSRQILLSLARLEPRQRQVITLAFFHELTHDQVAFEMTLPLGTVKTWIRRGCQQIRQQLEPR